MSSTLEMLRAQEKEIRGRIASLHAELGDVAAAVAAIEARHNPPPKPGAAKEARAALSINDGIVEAVRNGRGAPTPILHFLKRELGIDTTRNSVSTRLGKLREAGLLAHNGSEWIIAPKNETPSAGTEGASRNTGEGDASPYESQKEVRDLL